MSDRESEIFLPDGRRLEIATAGDPDGRTVFLHHGTPSDAGLVTMFDPTASERGYHFVSLSRPGYGASSRLTGRSASSVVADVRAVLDHFGRTEYVAVGWSGGGPHALACAALDAPRCRAAISLAGLAPARADFDWSEGMGPENVEEFALARAGGPEYEEFIRVQRDYLVEATSDNVIELLGGLLSEPDLTAMESGPAGAQLAASFARGLANSHHGLYDDDCAFMADWGFALTDITVPVEIWFGDEDLMVPPSHGHYLGEQIPGAELFHRPEEGHVSLVTRHLGTLYDHLGRYAD